MVRRILLVVSFVLVALATSCGGGFDCDDVCTEVNRLCSGAQTCQQQCQSIWSQLSAEGKDAAEQCVKAAQTCAAIEQCQKVAP